MSILTVTRRLLWKSCLSPGNRAPCPGQRPPKLQTCTLEIGQGHLLLLTIVCLKTHLAHSPHQTLGTCYFDYVPFYLWVGILKSTCTVNILELACRTIFDFSTIKLVWVWFGPFLNIHNYIHTMCMTFNDILIKNAIKLNLYFQTVLSLYRSMYM